MKKRNLGSQGLAVSSLGLGCMGLTWAYGPTKEAESIKVLNRAIDLGINFLDTAEVYGPFNNEELIGRVIKGHPRQNLIIASKFGFRIDDHGNIIAGVNSHPNHIKQSIEGSLKRLGTDYIDLYYQHRLDPAVPIEETIYAMAQLVKEGKVKYIGLSEVGPGIIRRAHAIHPITAVQSEYSIWERGVEENVLPTLKELGIGFVPFSPLGRGFLTGKINSLADFHETDWLRANFPRLEENNFAHNFKLVKIIQEVAAQYQITPAQVVLAWLLRQGENIVPIPGTKHISYLEENVQAINLELPESAWDSLNTVIRSFKPQGERYTKASMELIDHTE